MARFTQNLNNFISGLSAAYAGHVAGSLAGHQQAMVEAEQERQKKAQEQQQALQLFEAYHNLYGQQQAEADKPYELLGTHMKDLAPPGQAAALGEILKHYGSRAPNPYGTSALPGFLQTGTLPNPATTPNAAPPPSTGVGGKGFVSQASATGAAPAAAPEPAPATSIVQKQPLVLSPDQEAPGALVYAPGYTPPAPGEKPAAAQPTVMSPGGVPLPIKGGVDQHRLARIADLRKQFVAAMGRLPEGDERRGKMLAAVNAPGVSPNPGTDDEADVTERAYQNALYNFAPPDTTTERLTAGNLKDTAKALGATWAQIPGMDPQQQLQAILDAGKQAGVVGENASRMKLAIVLPPSLVGERKNIAHIQELYDKGDAASLQQAQEEAHNLANRIKFNLSPEKALTAFNSVLNATARLNPYDKDYEKKSFALYQRAGIPYLYTEGLNGAAAQKAWQAWSGRLASVAPLDKRARRFILSQGRQIAKLAGVDPSQIPEDISKTLTPADKLTYHRLLRVETEDYQKDQTFQTNMALAQQRLAKATGPSSERDKNVLLAANSRYAKALKAVQQLKKDLEYTDEDLRGGTYLKPDERKKALAAEGELKAATDAANAIAARIVKGVPATGQPAVVQQQAGSVRQRAPFTVNVNGRQVTIDPSTFDADARARGMKESQIRAFHVRYRF